jgi:hypothetical protein
MGQFAALNHAADTQDDITLAMATHVRLGNLDLAGDVDAVEARVIEHLVSQRVKREIRRLSLGRYQTAPDDRHQSRACARPYQFQ